jgi:hypothetical protein
MTEQQVETALAADGSEETVELAWEARVRVLTNRSAWTSMGLAVGIPALLLGALMAAITRSVAGVGLAAVAFAVILVIFVFVGGVIDIFGGFGVAFLLTSRGVRSTSGKASRAAVSAALVAGLLSGKPGLLGSGLLARSEQDVFIPYPQVTRLKVNARRRYVVVRGDWAQKPIGLYCTEENFPEVLRLLKENCPPAVTPAI